MSITSLSPQQLRQAADIQEQIQGLQSELQQVLGVEAAAPALEAPEPAKKGRKRFSAKSRAKMAAAQKARWAAKRGEAPPTEAEKPARQPKKTKKQVMEARLKALAKAREARWAKVKRAGKARL